jgi:hypothetical protein
MKALQSGSGAFLGATPPEVPVGHMVMVRGFGGEPRRLQFVGVDGPYLIVKKEDTPFSLGLHPSDVFEWDEELFAQISDAFAAADFLGLQQAWQSALPLIAKSDAESGRKK